MRRALLFAAAVVSLAWRPLLFAAVLVSLTLWAYQPVRSAGWVYEDRATYTSSRTTHAESVFNQRSLSAWTWRLTPTPASAHAVNLALHLIIGGLVGMVAWRLGLTPLGAWAAATAWLLHPITVELAAYVKARADEIALIGILIAVIAAAGQWWRGWGLTGIVLGTLIAVGGKQAGVVVLLLVPMVIWHCRDRRDAPLWAPWWLPAVLAAILIAEGVMWYGGLRLLVNADTEANVSMATDVRWWQWLFAQAGAVSYWSMATVWPALLTPDADIDSLSAGVRVGGLGLLAGSAGVAWLTRTRAPLVSLGCAWVVLGVLPRLVMQTPRSYLNAAQWAVAFVGVAFLIGLSVQWIKTQWAGSPHNRFAHS